MILKLNTNILPMLQPGLYGTILGGYYEDVPEEEGNNFKKLLCEKGREIMNEMLDEEIYPLLGEMEVKEVTFHSPMFYNFENDWFEFFLEMPDNTPQTILYYLENETMWKFVEGFYEWMFDKYHTRDGFISFMPYTKEKYIAAIQGKDLEKSVSMFLTFLLESKISCYPLETYQRDFEDEMNDICLVNGWYVDYEEE